MTGISLSTAWLPNRLENMRSLVNKILISATFLNQVLSSVTNLHPHKSAEQFTSWYRIQNLRKLFRSQNFCWIFLLSEEVSNIQIFRYYGPDVSQQLTQPWLHWPPPWKLKPIISYFPDYNRCDQGRLIN